MNCQISTDSCSEAKPLYHCHAQTRGFGAQIEADLCVSDMGKLVFGFGWPDAT